MKVYLLKKGLWVAIGLAFAVSFLGCAHKTQKPETKPPESSETAPASKPATPGEPAPPSREPGRAPARTPPKEAPPVNKESYYTHTVKFSGESLSIIAAWYTGDLKNWEALAEVMKQKNPNADINRIYLGEKILIPESLLKTRDPITKEFVDSFYSKPKTEKASPKRPETETEEPKLFGPKELPKK